MENYAAREGVCVVAVTVLDTRLHMAPHASPGRRGHCAGQSVEILLPKENKKDTKTIKIHRMQKGKKNNKKGGKKDERSMRAWKVITHRQRIHGQPQLGRGSHKGREGVDHQSVPWLGRVVLLART